MRGHIATADMKALKGIVADGVEAERIATGFLFTEGPVWDAGEGCLYFSDIPSDVIHRWHPDRGCAVMKAPSAKSNGLTRDRDGGLLICEHAGRRVSRMDADGGTQAVATHYKGRRFNSPNDIVVKSDGAIYFTDPPYGLNPTFGAPGRSELGFCGVFRVAPGGGDIEAVADSYTPNGLAFSPDESRLYVADTEANVLLVHDVGPAGGLSPARMFAAIDGHPAPDGVKVDRDGNVYTTGEGGIWVLSPDGATRGVIPLPEMPANLAWGGDDWSVLYVTARASVYRVPTLTSGIPV